MLPDWGTLINRATVYGIGSDNPQDPNFLTDLQGGRAVMALFENVGSFQVRYAIAGCCTTGRNFMVSGYSDAIRPLCSKPPPARRSHLLLHVCDRQACIRPSP